MYSILLPGEKLMLSSIHFSPSFYLFQFLSNHFHAVALHTRFFNLYRMSSLIMGVNVPYFVTLVPMQSLVSR